MMVIMNHDADHFCNMLFLIFTGKSKKKVLIILFDFMNKAIIEN